MFEVYRELNMISKKSVLEYKFIIYLLQRTKSKIIDSMIKTLKNYTRPQLICFMRLFQFDCIRELKKIIRLFVGR